MKISRLSAYTIENDASKPTLDFTEYSKFKYGHRPTAIRFAERMVQTFLAEFGFQYFVDNGDQLTISTSPYWHTPPAACALGKFFHYMVNEMLLDKGRGPLLFAPIQRSAAPVTDFGKLSAEERKLNLSQNRLNMDEDLLRGRKLIIIEDARITGAHEEKIIKFAEENGLEELVFVYVVSVSYGAADPDIENRMNHQWVGNLDAVHLLMKRPEDFVLNGRTCRLIFSWADEMELADFCKRLNDQAVFDLYACAVNDGYGQLENYRKGFDAVRREAKVRHDHLLKIGDVGLPVAPELVSTS